MKSQYEVNMNMYVPKISSSASMIRPTVAEVDLCRIASNFVEIKKRAPGKKVWAVVKADAYGHGAVKVTRHLMAQGAQHFCVALVEEAFELKEAGVCPKELLILNGAYEGAYREVVEAGFQPVVFDSAHVEKFAEASIEKKVQVHLKVDTGMSRLGVQMKELPSLLKVFEKNPQVELRGLMTHFASADEEEDFTREQVRVFEEAIAMVRHAGFSPTEMHAANSAAIFSYPWTHFGGVRPGISLYGYVEHEGRGQGLEAGLRPALSLKSRVLSLRTIEAGESVGYGRTFRADRTSHIATVPMGYADGFFRFNGNRAFALVGGVRCPVVGRVSMDLIGLDVTKVPHVKLGDEVVLIGEQGEEKIDAQMLAETSQTIPYEVLTSISRRVPRKHIENK